AETDRVLRIKGLVEQKVGDGSGIADIRQTVPEDEQRARSRRLRAGEIDGSDDDGDGSQCGGGPGRGGRPLAPAACVTMHSVAFPWWVGPCHPRSIPLPQ